MSEKVAEMKFELPEPCAIGEHIPVIVSRCGGSDTALHNACGKCGRLILNLAGTWIIDTYREQSGEAEGGRDDN